MEWEEAVGMGGDVCWSGKRPLEWGAMSVGVERGRPDMPRSAAHTSHALSAALSPHPPPMASTRRRHPRR